MKFLVSICTLVFTSSWFSVEFSCLALPVLDNFKRIAHDEQLLLNTDLSSSVNQEGYESPILPSKQLINEDEPFNDEITSGKQNGGTNSAFGTDVKFPSRNTPMRGASPAVSETDMDNRALPGTGTGNRDPSKALAIAMKKFVNGVGFVNDVGKFGAKKSQNVSSLGKNVEVEAGSQAGSPRMNEEEPQDSKVSLKNDKEEKPSDKIDAAAAKPDEKHGSNETNKASNEGKENKEVSSAGQNQRTISSAVQNLRTISSAGQNQGKLQPSNEGDNGNKNASAHKDEAVKDQPITAASKSSIGGNTQNAKLNLVHSSSKMEEAESSATITENFGENLATGSKKVAGNGTNSANGSIPGGGSTERGSEASSAKTGKDVTTAYEIKKPNMTGASTATSSKPVAVSTQDVVQTQGKENSLHNAGILLNGGTNSIKDDESSFEDEGNALDDEYDDPELNFSREDGEAPVDGKDSHVGDNNQGDTPVKDGNQGDNPDKDVDQGDNAGEDVDPFLEENSSFSNEKLGQDAGFSNKREGTAGGSMTEFNGDGYLSDADAEYHFGYLLLLTIFGALAYFMYLKRKKVLALLLEGRRSSTRRGSISRRPRSRSSGYSLLRSGGEEPQVSPDSKESSDQARLERIY